MVDFEVTCGCQDWIPAGNQILRSATRVSRASFLNGKGFRSDFRVFTPHKREHFKPGAESDGPALIKYGEPIASSVQ
jgi:hypothetical protein